jgi:PleD family two-component response regulator
MFVAEKIRSLIGGSTFVTRVGDTPVTASFGVAATGPSGPDLLLKVEGLIKAADLCLYQSKQQGRDRTTGIEIANSMAMLANG